MRTQQQQIKNIDLWRMCHAMEALRRLVPTAELPAQLVCVFLFIASKEGSVTLKEIEKGLSYKQSSVSRLTGWLGDKTRTGENGLKWVIKDSIGQNKTVRLTPLGERVAQLLWETIFGDDENLDGFDLKPT